MSTVGALVQLPGPRPRPARADVRVTRARSARHLGLDRIPPRSAGGGPTGAPRPGACDGWDLLDTLLDLPADLPVPVSDLSPPAPAGGRCRPRGGDYWRGDRHACAGSRGDPLLAIVVAGRWDDLLVRASRFAPYCARMAVGSCLPAGADVLGTAARLGIWVASRADSGSADVLLEPEPEPVADWPPTTAWWWRFCEAVYGQASPPGR